MQVRFGHDTTIPIRKGWCDIIAVTYNFAIYAPYAANRRSEDCLRVVGGSLGISRKRSTKQYVYMYVAVYGPHNFSIIRYQNEPLCHSPIHLFIA